MSKRGGAELNHDNWDQEVEREDAGKFMAASAEEMKGRVIKRARRRGAAGDGDKKSAFGGFGGFSAAPKADAGAAFSFLAKSSVPDKPNTEGFSFGSSDAGGLKKASGDEQTAGLGGFSFGSSSVSVGGIGMAKPAPSFGSFGSGTESPASKSSFSFGSNHDETSSTAPAKAAFTFGQTPKSPEPEKPLEKSGPPANLFGSFGSPVGASDPVFGSKSPVAAVAPAAATFSFGKAASPAFGKSAEKPDQIEAPTDTTATATGMASGSTNNSGFSFGQAAAQEKPTAVPLGGSFSFGGSKSLRESSEVSKSITSPTDSPPPSLFAFGAKTDSEPTKPASLAFGEKTSNNVENKKEPTPVENPFKSNSGPSDTNGDNKPSQYLSHIKALNVQVLSWLKMHIDKDPLIILSPVFKDYEKHLNDIEKEFGEDRDKRENKVVQVTEREPEVKAAPKSAFGNAFGAPPVKELVSEAETKLESENKSSLFSFGAAASLKPAPAPESGFSFGASTEVSKPIAASSPFSFGTSSASAGVGSGFVAAPATGGFSFGGFGSSAAAQPAGNTEKKEEAEDEEDKPPVVEVKQVEETDALYSKKCKLFYKKDGSYVEKGVGMLYLKSVDGGKTQLLVRADTNLGNVLLNILLSPGMATTRVGKNNVMLVCIPNPPVDPKADSSEPCPMLIR